MVGEEPSLKHLVWRCRNPRNEIGGREGGLFHLGKVVLRVSVEHHTAYRDGWEVSMEPDLGDIEGIEAVFLGLLGSHDLDFHSPGRVVASCDGLMEIPGCMIGVFTFQLGAVVAGEILNPLLRLEVILHPVIDRKSTRLNSSHSQVSYAVFCF